MKLADASLVTAKLGIGSTPDQFEQADAGLEFATTQIENVLDTSLQRAVIKDIFDYFPGKYADPSKFAKLQLIASQGFWDSALAVEVHMSVDGLKLPATLTSATLVDPQYYSINYEQGTVQLLLEPLQGLSTVALTYTAGFEEGAQEAPQWLQQAAVGYAVYNIGIHSVGYNRKDYRDKSAEKRPAAYGVLSQHIRTRLGMYPSATVYS